MNNGKTKKIVFVTVKYFLMALLAVILLFPFFVMFTRSFMTWREATSYPVQILPESLNFSSYAEAMNSEFFIYFKNTVIVLLVNVIGGTLSAYIVSYGFARIRFQGNNILFAVALSTMMLPGIVSQVPLYVAYSKIGWLNTLLPLTIPQLFGGGMVNIFLIRQYLRSVPKSYNEAAMIDGASELRTCFEVILPMVKPVVLLTAVNTFMACWNDFTTPLMYIDSTASDKFTLAVGIYYRFLGAVTNKDKAPNVQMALCILMMIPSLIIFALFQRSLIEGVSLTGLKG